MQISAEYSNNALIIQLNNMTGAVVYTGKYKEDLEHMRLTKMTERARRIMSASINLSRLRPLKLCGKGGNLVSPKLKVHVKKPLMLPKYRVIKKTPHALLRFLHYDVIPNNVDHTVVAENGDRVEIDESDLSD